MLRYPSIAEKHKSGSTLLWLAYSFFFFIQPFVQPTLKLWLASLTVFAIFVAVFLTYTGTRNEAVRRWMIAATFALGLCSFPWNAGASTFFIYCAAFLPFSFESVRKVLALFVVEMLGICAETGLFHVLRPHSMSWPNSLIAILLLGIIGGGNIFFAQERRASCKLRAAQEENIALAAVAERERIARDLHDVLGHTLSVIVLKAELAGRLLDRDPIRAAREVSELEQTARSALAEVREAIGGYRSRGLLAEIETARRTLDAAGVTLHCNAMPHTAASLSAEEETVLALALREAVTNIVRHACATTCTLHFTTERGQRQLVVEDNGRHHEAREGNGLRGMRERVEALGGSIAVERHGGTRLHIELPLPAETPAG